MNFELIKKSAEAGDAKAMCNLGLIYLYGTGVDQDYTQAFYWFEKSAEAGNLEAMNNLGVMYSKGHGVDQDDAKCFHWIKKAASGGDNGVDLGTDMQDDAKALYWFKKLRFAIQKQEIKK